MLLGYVVLIKDNTWLSPKDMFTFMAVAGSPLLLNLLFSRSSKNCVSDVIFLIAAVLYSVPAFILLLPLGDNPNNFDIVSLTFTAIFYSLAILIPCWILAAGVNVFFKVSRPKSVPPPLPPDKEFVKENWWVLSHPHSLSANEQSEKWQIASHISRIATICTTGVLLITLLALGVFFSLVQGSPVVFFSRSM